MGGRQSKVNANVLSAERILGSSECERVRTRVKQKLCEHVEVQETSQVHASLREQDYAKRVCGGGAAGFAAARLARLCMDHSRLECCGPSYVCEDGAVLAAALQPCSAVEAMYSLLCRDGVIPVQICASCIEHAMWNSHTAADEDEEGAESAPSIASSCANAVAHACVPLELNGYDDWLECLRAWALSEPGRTFTRMIEAIAGGVNARARLVQHAPVLERNGVSASRCVLNEGTAWLLCQHLHRSEGTSPRWHLLFSTVSNGSSFSALATRTSRRGPILLCIRDTLQQEACALLRPRMESWSEAYGDAGVFLARLAPRFEIFTAQNSEGESSCVQFRHGFTSNHDVVGVFSTGKQAALALGPELHEGQSGATSLFGNSTKLLGDQSDPSNALFKAEEVEAWAIDHDLAGGEGTREEPYRRPDPANNKRGRAIDKYQADRNFLQTAIGVGGASEGM